MRIFLSLLFFCIIAYVILTAWLYFNQRNMMYHPEKDEYNLAYYNLKNTKEVTLTTIDGLKLQAWYHKPSKNKPMAIFLHGNAGNLGDRADKLQELIVMGYGFIIPAWRGFGKSEGTPSLQGLYLDAEAAINFARKEGYKINKTIMIGESLGTGIATKMASKYRFKGLFLITPYTSIANRAQELYPVIMIKKFLKDNFSVIDNIKCIDQPLFIIHGTADNIIPYQHSENILQEAQEPKKLILYPNIGHVNYNITEAFTQMDKFFKNN